MLLLEGLSSLANFYWLCSSAPSPALQWTVAKAFPSVRSMLDLWIQLPVFSTKSGLKAMETELENSLKEATKAEIAHFQLACIYWELRELLGIQANQPMLVVEHLRYIRGCLRSYKEAKQILRKQEVQLKQEQSERSALQQENANLQREKETLQQELDSLKRVLTKGQLELDQAKEENRKLAKSALDLNVRFGQANHQAQQREVKLRAELTEVLNTANAKSTTLELQLRSQIATLTKQLSEATNTPSSLQKELRAANAKCACFEQQIRSDSEQIAALKAQLSEATSQPSFLRKDLQAANTKSASLEKQLRSNAQQLSRATYQSATLQQTLQTTNEKCVRMTSIAECREQELSEIKSIAQCKAQELREMKSIAQYRAHELSEIKSIAQCKAQKLREMKSIAQCRAQELSEMKQTLQQLEQMERKPSSGEGTGVDTVCSACMEVPPNVVFEPCRHACVCAACSKKVSKCPKCRAYITGKDKVYL